jgi:phosphoglycolate phosphatase-like HAD superfamily hydrolase
MIKAVIFDIDGTLVDTVDLHAESWVRAFKHFGIDAPYEEVRARIGEGGDRIIAAFAGKATARADEIEAYRSDLFKRDYLPRARAFPGVRALFQRVRAAGQKAVLGSSCKAHEIEAYKALARIEDLVDAAATSDDADRSKPAPDIFQAALREVAPIAAAEAMVVGDSVYDAQAAARAGIGAVGLLCGGTPEARLRAAGFLAVYRDPEDLLRRYDQSPLAAHAAGASRDAAAAS